MSEYSSIIYWKGKHTKTKAHAGARAARDEGGFSGFSREENNF